VSVVQQGETVAAGVRIIDGVTTRFEKPLLHWLAERVPQRVVPDHLTLLGVAGAVLMALSLVACHVSKAFLWLALLGLAINWLGDSLDGTVARLRQIERPRYGFFVDYMSDLLSQVLIVLGMGLSPYLRFDIACVGLVTYLILSIYTLAKLHVSRSVHQLTYFGVGPTEVRILICVGIGVVGVTSWPALATPIGMMSIFDCVLLSLVLFALASTVLMFLHDAKLLAVIEPPRSVIPAEVSMIEVPGFVPSELSADIKDVFPAGPDTTRSTISS
jgi:archaetidylinositol phosphate synthase